MPDPLSPTDVQGLVASRKHSKVLWMAESSGQGSRLVAISLDNERLGTSELGETARAVVSLSIGPGPEPSLDYIYAMVGRNLEATRNTVQILRIPEPDPANLGTIDATVLELLYPDKFSGARANFVDPVTGDAFVVAADRGQSYLYRANAPLTSDEPSMLELVASFSGGIGLAIAGADISATGDAIVVGTDRGVAFWERPQGMSVPEAIAQPSCVGFGRFESIAFQTDGSGLLTFSRDAQPILYAHELPEHPDMSLDDSNRAGNLPPTVAITQPASNFQWSVGDEIVLEAEIQDDRALDEARLEWNVTILKCNNQAECVPFSRQTLKGTSVLTLDDMPALPAILRIEAAYTDQGSLSGRDAVDLLPLASTINVLSTPPGLEVRANGVAQPTPFSFEAAFGDVLELDSELQLRNGRLYAFAGWLETDHTGQGLEVLENTMTLTAQFELQVPAVEVHFSNSQIAPVATSERNQDKDSIFSIEDDGRTLRIIGNGWKQISLPYVVTKRTVLIFDFSSSSEGDIHGIKFAQPDDDASAQGVLNVYGTQGVRIGGNYSGSGIQTFIIPVGDFYTGDMVRIQFVNDHDIDDPTAESVFSDVRIYELP